MTAWPILTLELAHEVDVVAVRQRARRLAELLSFETQDQTRIATAVSEIARNAVVHAGGGRAEFALSGSETPQHLLICVVDDGPGIEDIGAALAGRAATPAGLGRGMLGARRLVDGFEVQSRPGAGTRVVLNKRLPEPAVRRSAIVGIIRRLAADTAGDPLSEVRAQNRELLHSLEELTRRQEETTRLNAEMESTNRGVVALYAELDQKAVELEQLNASLEQRVAAAVGERERVEEALRQAQKMEAVGQLTGGIAHDFNNLLQIITGNLEILRRNLPEDAARLRRSADNAMLGAQRAATLTQRLLAFSRRQPLDPKPIDVNQLVSGMTDLIRRTIGEPIAIETAPAPGLWSVEADPNQLENALLNLAVNARDAMPLGGVLTVQTANVRLDEAYAKQNPGVAPGEYVAITVADTGVGMSAEVLARVFEPFFTTKDVGQGTGLGLSMVYGFAKQSSGHVALSSEPHRGTTVKLYLPRLRGTAQAQPAPSEAVISTALGDEVILAVEDDPGVRAYTVEAFSELGYRVIEAADGPAALDLIRDLPRLDLLFSDVVLPGGMSGRQLAEQARRLRPDLRVLFTTGYARDAIVHDGRLDADVQMIGKPFNLADLAARVRDSLDRKSA